MLRKHGAWMKSILFAAVILLALPLYVFSACPTMNCPDDQNTPVAEYLFENNLLDTSGHGLDAVNANPASPVTFTNNVGGRPGFCVGNFTFNSNTGIDVPACVIYSSQGEIEWYQYITNPANAMTNYFLFWTDSITDHGGISMFPGDGGYFGPTFFRLDYRYWNGSGSLAQEYGGEWIQFNQWQHCNFQWGSFGTRLIVDGVMVVGSVNQWYQGLQDTPYIVIGTWGGANTGFSGYIDDLIFWPCSGHGTPTVTTTPTITETLTDTETPTVSPTSSITQTSSVSPTISCSPTITYTPTIPPTLTVSPTPTISPTPSSLKLLGIFPNPGKNNIKLIFSSDASCRSILTIWTVSGEKVDTIKTPASPGMNVIVINTVNPGYPGLASGAYICSLELDYSWNRKKHFWSRFAIIK